MAKISTEQLPDSMWWLYGLINKYIFHWTPEKAVYVGGHSLLWDARCSGIYIGIGIGLIWHFIYARRKKNLPMWPVLLISVFLLSFMFVDLLTVLFNIRETSNDVRLLTGILFGSSLALFIYPAFVSFFLQRKETHTGMHSISMYIIYLALNVLAFCLIKLNWVVIFYMMSILSIIGFVGILLILLLCVLKALASFLQSGRDPICSTGRDDVGHRQDYVVSPKRSE